MKRSVLLWLLVIAGVAGAVSVRVGRQRRSREEQPAPTSQATAFTLSSPHDYVSAPVVLPEERDNGPRSIISLAPSITETCCALGLLDRLVGRTAYCIIPPAVKNVPDVGALVDANMEMITTIKPEIVLLSQNASRVRDQMISLRVPYEGITDDSFEGIFLSIRRVGEIARRPKTAARLIENLQDELAAISSAAQTHRAQRVLIVLDELPVPPRSIFVAGPDLFLSRLLSRLGHLNAAESVVRGKSGELSLEQVVMLNPDVIIETRPNATPKQMDELYSTWSQIGALKAIRNHAVRSYGDKTNLVSSPRINIVYYELARALAEWQ